MGSTDRRSLKTGVRIRNRGEEQSFFNLPHHEQPPHPASLSTSKRRSLLGLTKGRRR